MGKPFMPWQQHVADVILEINPATGRLAYDEVGLTVPRQSGKSTFILAKSTHRASATSFFGGRQNVVYTAQTRKDARKKWEEDYAAELEASRVFRSRVQVHKGNGNEHIRFTNGSRFGIESSTEKAGHGGTIDEADIDEAFAQIDNRLEQAFGPAMITRKNRQLLWISTAGWLDGSEYLQEKTKLGRASVAAGRNTGLAYFEWSAAEDCDPGDPEVWFACMPALGHTISFEAIQAEYDKALDADKLNDFKRAYLNLWVPKPKMTAVEMAIPAISWAASEDLEERIGTDPVFTLDVSPKMTHAALGVAGDSGSGLHAGLLQREGEDEVDSHPGTEWVLPALLDLKTRVPSLRVSIAANGQAKSLAPDIEAAGIPVDRIPAADVAAACGLTYKLITGGGLTHPQQTDLDDAAAAVQWLDSGEGAQVWGRRRSGAQITPFYAFTLAVWKVHSGDDRSPGNNIW